jgi:hypothetical protein
MCRLVCGLFSLSKALFLVPRPFTAFGILRNKDNGVNSIPNMDNTTFLKIGATARWKFLHAGIYANAGKEISYLGYRLGVSF